MLCQAQLGSRAPPINHGARQKLWKIPNSKGTGVGLGANDGGQFLYINWSGSLQPYGQAWAGYDRHADQTDRDFGTNFLLDLSKGNPIFSDLVSTVQPTAMRGLWLLKAY